MTAESEGRPLFATEGERLLHRWAVRDADRLYAIERRLRWLERPWWRRIGRRPPPIGRSSYAPTRPKGNP